jgi:putative membrane protein
MSDGWEQLHPRTIPVTLLTVAGILAGVAVPIIIGIDDVPLWLSVAVAFGGIVVVSGLAAVADLMRWRYTTYRVTDERVELRYAWVLHKLRSVPRDRVRTVDLTANPLQRVFGVAKVKIGTGQQTSEHSQLTLDPVSTAVAEELRRVLLRRASVVEEPQAAGPDIARLDWRWIRYAPISVTTPLLGAAAFGAVMQVADWFKLQGRLFGMARDLIGDPSVAEFVVILVLAGVILGVVGSLGLFVEMWYRYRLSHEDGNLVMTRAC